MIRECEDRWNVVARGVTNYKTLLDQIERFRKPDERVCLVTFNYDRMIERALPTVGVAINELPDYIANDRYMLVKLHGSVDWVREVETGIPALNEMEEVQAANTVIDRAADLKLTDRYHRLDKHPVGKASGWPLFPAIAIPVVTKQDYECPTDHLDALRQFIPKTTKVLMIGWRAMEKHFLKMLKEGITQQLLVTAVAGSLDGAKESVTNLKNAGLEIHPLQSEHGFTDFIVNREADGFLRT